MIQRLRVRVRSATTRNKTESFIKSWFWERLRHTCHTVQGHRHWYTNTSFEMSPIRSTPGRQMSKLHRFECTDGTSVNKMNWDDRISLVKGLPTYLCFVDIYDVYKDVILAWQIQYQIPPQTYAHIKPSKFYRFHNPLPWEEGHRHYHRSSWKHPEVAWFGPEETSLYTNSKSFLAIWSCTNPSPHWAVQQWYAMLPLRRRRNK